MQYNELRFTIGEIEVLLWALNNMPFEARCATPVNFYLLKRKLEREQQLLK